MPLIPASRQSPRDPVDAYLHVQGQRAGKIKGESTAAGQEDDIIVMGWQWGLKGSHAVGAGRTRAQPSMTALTLIKLLDRATTALMSVAATNEVIKEAKLSLRRPTGEQEVYFQVTLEHARVTSVTHEMGNDGHPIETVVFEFKKSRAEYWPQQSSGARSGSTEFSFEILGD